MHCRHAGSRSVCEAATAPAALRAMVEMHASFVPNVLPAYLAIERERSADPEIEAAFPQRSEGRRQLARITLLLVEHDGSWSICSFHNTIVGRG